jgi:hypothetical protein
MKKRRSGSTTFASGHERASEEFLPKVISQEGMICEPEFDLDREEYP